MIKETKYDREWVMSGRSAANTRLAEIDPFALEREWVGELRGHVETTLRELLPVGSENRLHDAMRQAVLSPGKRLRPVLALLCADHLGCSIDRAMPAACALELVHAASLVLDDLPCMDDAPMRRGEPSIHARHGEDIAVLAGVALLSEAFAVLARSPQIEESARLRMVAILARTVGASGLVDGQAKDLRRAVDASASSLRQVHHQKTGVLFVASVEMGAVAADASPATIEVLRAFAIELGLAFQALDDLDDQAELGGANTGANLLTVFSPTDLREEAAARIAGAKAALRRGDPRLHALQGYVDLLMSPQREPRVA